MRPYVAKLTKERHTQKTISILKKLANIIIYASMLFFIALGMLYIRARDDGKNFTVIASNSMTPVYDVKDIVVYSQKFGDKPYVPGDNIVFVVNGKDGKTTQVFHKLIRVSEGYDRFYTKGINNNSEDEGFRLISDIIGSEDYHIKSKLLSSIIIFISSADKFNVLKFLILVCVFVMIFRVILILKPKYSVSERAQIDGVSVNNFQRLLGEYNCCLGNNDQQGAKKRLEAIKNIKLRLMNLETYAAKADTTCVCESRSGVKKTSKKKKALVKGTSQEFTKEPIGDKPKEVTDESAMDKKAKESDVAEVESLKNAEKKRAEINYKLDELKKILAKLENGEALTENELKEIGVDL